MTLKRGDSEVFFGEGAVAFFSSSLSDKPRPSSTSVSSESSPDSELESSAADSGSSALSSLSDLSPFILPRGASRSENPSSRSSLSSAVFFLD